MPKTDVLTLEAMFAPSEQFRSSDLQRRYRTVLDKARTAPVLVTDKDGYRLAVGDWDELVFAALFMRIVDQIGQFHAAWARHRDGPPAEWAAMTPFPFLAVFDAQDVQQFADELVPYLEESVRRRDLDGWLGNLRAWQSSAETYDDKRILAHMNVELDQASLIELSPPSE